MTVIGLVGYKWLEREREIEPRRGKDAAEAEAAGIRQALTEHLGAVAVEVAQKWTGRVSSRPPFALPPDIPQIVESAYLLSGDGKLIYPDYERAYHRAINEYQAISARPE